MREFIKRGAVIFWTLVAFIISQGTASSAEINIGFTGPLTGPAAYIGIDSVHGLQIAAKELNDEGGVEVAGKKYTVNIRPYDDEGNAAKAVAGMQRLKDRYDVPAIFQGLSGAIMGMLERNEKLNVLLFGYFKHPKATTIGNKLVLRMDPTFQDEAGGLAASIVKIVKPKSYATISELGDYGKNFTSFYKDFFEKNGVQLVATEWLDGRTQTDFRGQLTKIKAAKPDVIMMTAYDEASAGVIKQAHELDIKIPFALTSGFQSVGEKMTGTALIEGYYKPISRFQEDPLPYSVDRYKNQLYPKMGYKEPSGPYGLGTYGQLLVIIKAMKHAGTTTDPLKIRQSVPLVLPMEEKHNIHGYQAFEENGDARVSYPIGRYHNGKLVVVK